MENQRYKRIYEKVCNEFRKTNEFCHGAYDEMSSALLVFQSAKQIIERGDLNVDKDLVLISAILHDVGKAYINENKIFGKEGLLKDYKVEWKKHAKLSEEPARNILTSLDYPKDFIEKVCGIVKLHDTRDLPRKTKELMIVQDADVIADIGFLGFIRPFMFSGRFKSQSILDSMKHFNNKEDYDKIRSKLNLEISKEILKEKIFLEKELIRKMRISFRL